MRWREAGILKLFLTSYLIVALVPLLLWTAFYSHDIFTSTQNVLMEEMQQETAQTMKALELQLSAIQYLPHELSSSQEVQNYRAQKDTLSRRALINRLKTAVSGNDLIENIWLYYRDSETLVSAYNNSWDKRLLMEEGPFRGLYYENLTYDELFDLLEQVRSLTVLPSSTIQTAMHARAAYLTFVQSIIPDNRYAYASILILVKSNELTQMISTSNDFVLLDAAGQVVLASGEGAHAADYVACLERQAGPGSRGVFRAEVGQSEQLIAYHQSLSEGWTLIEAMPMDALYRRLRLTVIRILVITGVAALLLTGVLILVMNRTYRPIEQIASLAEDVSTPQRADTARNLGTIEHALTYLHSQNGMMSALIQSMTPMAEEHTIRRVVSTPSQQWTAQMEEEVRKLSIPVDLPRYQVVILYYQKLDALRHDILDLARLVGPRYVSSFVEEGKHQIVVILGGEAGAADLYQEIRLSALQVSNLAAGMACGDIHHLHDSYTQATMTFHYLRLHRSEQQIFHYQMLPELSRQRDSYPWSLMQSFSAAVSQQNEKMTILLSRKIIATIQTIRGETQFPLILFCQTMACFMDALPDCNTQIADEIKAAYHPESTMGIPEMCSVIESLTEMFVARVKGREQERSAPIIASIEYIRQNLASNQLSLASAASAAGMSASYFSNQFRQEMNCSFKEYVDAQRLHRAQRLLTETTLKISEVAEQSGYDNPYSFSRFFKAQMDVTPQEYRSTHK